MPEYEFDALVIAPGSMIPALARFVQGRCCITYPGHALTGRRFKEIYAFDGKWVNDPGMADWIDNVQARFDEAGKEIRWIGESQ